LPKTEGVIVQAKALPAPLPAAPKLHLVHFANEDRTGLISRASMEQLLH